VTIVGNRRRLALDKRRVGSTVTVRADFADR
jgi:hypothetical protein